MRPVWGWVVVLGMLAAQVSPAFVAPAFAISDPGEMLADPALGQRAERIGAELRCLVCQNESIEDSNADLAKDLRRIVRQRVAAGESDESVVGFLVSRYGDFVRLRPPVRPETVLLWASPVIALLVGFFAFFASRRRVTLAPVPLSAAEEARLTELSEPNE